MANIMSTNAGRAASTNMVQLIFKVLARDISSTWATWARTRIASLPASTRSTVDPKSSRARVTANASITDPAVVAAGFTPPYAGFTGTWRSFPQTLPTVFRGECPG
jgi:hypothetical protein